MNGILRKVTALTLAVALVYPIIFFSSTTTPVYAAALGDLDASGVVDASDALLVLKHVVKLNILPDTLLANADANVDNTVDASDALEILRYTVKLIPCFKGTVESPTEALEIITNHVKNYGEIDSESGVRYIYDWCQDTSDPEITFNWIPEVDYNPATKELSFHLAYGYDDPADNTTYFDNVKMVINGNTAEAAYYVSLQDGNGEYLMEAELATSFSISDVTGETTFTYTPVYPDDLTVDADWQAITDEGIHFALGEWNALLQSKFNITIQELGFTALSYNE